jgi:acyl-CoA hydrolase
LNHHGTLYAGRMADWFVEAGFIAAASLLDPKSMVCLKIHGLHFLRSVKAGEIIRFCAKIIHTGTSSLTANVRVNGKEKDKPIIDGFITFIHVDEKTKPAPHHIEIKPVSDEDKALHEKAGALNRR